MQTWYLFIAGGILCSFSGAAIFIDPVKMEVCDNAIDDDGNGLIDLNDPACVCQVLTPRSLIPNPSFEDTLCCPTGVSMMQCATGWIQASEPTSDYLHPCNWFGWTNLPRVPTPIPDGEACVGFRNGRYNSIYNSNWKEYIGSCLLGPLLAGKKYRIDFNMGFLTPDISPPLDLTLFGATSCQSLPFGRNDPTLGCPTNGPGWEELAFVNMKGTSEWVKGKLEFTPRRDIRAIVLGADCAKKDWPSGTDIYYFLDNLILTDAAQFDFVITASGNACSNQFSISVPERTDLTYQWYKDGIALPGETQPVLRAVPGEGSYVVRVQDGQACKVTSPYKHFIPSVFTSKQVTICEDDAYVLNNKALTTEGIYQDTLRSTLGCDSIVKIDLKVAGVKTNQVRVNIFPGETYKTNKEQFKAPGIYPLSLTSSLGCDSLVQLEVGYYRVFTPGAFSPNGDGINDVFEVYGPLDIEQVTSLTVYSRWGDVVFERNDGEGKWDGRQKKGTAQNGLYIYKAEIRLRDGRQHVLTGQVVVVR